MIRNVLLLFFIILLATGYTFYSDFSTKPLNKPDETLLEIKENSQKTPSFSFKDIKGKAYRLEDFKGKAIIVNFWASWCAPCVIEFPQMLDLAGTYKDESVFVFLSIDETREDIERFLAKQNKSVTASNVVIGWDQDKTISKDLFLTEKVPETFLIGKDFKLRGKIIGNDPAMQDKITRFIKP